MAKAKSFKSVINTSQNPVYSMVSDEEISNENWYKQRLNEYFVNRSNARKSIDNWTLTSGNKAQDTFQTRVWKLVDPYLSLASEEIDEKWQPVFTEEKIKAASQDLSGTLSKMKDYYWKDKAWAIDDYVEKWWYATRVLDYLEWKSTSPYRFQEPEKTKEWFENYIASAASTPTQQLWWIIKWLDSITWTSDWDKEYQSQVNDILKQNATTQDYERYKKEWYKPIEYTWDSYWFMDWIKAIINWDMSWKAREDASRSRKMLYDSYDKAVNEWFDWSVEDYVNYTIDVWEKTAESLADAIINSAKSNYTEWTLSSELWKLTTIWAELVTSLPSILSSLGLVWWIWNWTIWYLKTVWDIAAWWLEFQALEDAYNSKLSSISDYEESILWNAIWNAFFKTVWAAWKKLLTKLWWIWSKAEEAIVEAWADEYSKAVNTIKNSWNNAADTVQKEIWKIIDDADKTMEKDWISKWAEKERVEKFEVESDKDPKILLDNINDELATLWDAWESWAKTRKWDLPKLQMWETEEETLLRRKAERQAAKKAAKENTKEAQEKARKAQEIEEKRLAKMTPEERADEKRLKEINDEKAKKAEELAERKRKYELRIENESTYKKTTDDDAVDVMDVLKREWNKMFVEEWAEFNAVNLNDLIKTVRSALKWTEYWNDNAIKKIISWLSKTAEELDLWSKYNKASAEHMRAKDLITKLRDIFWKSRNVQSEASKQIELAWVWWQAIQKAEAAEVSELFSQIKRLYGIDLNNKIWMWIAALSLYDREAAEKMLKEIYPSIPWLTEFMIKSTMNLVWRWWWRVLANTKNINNVWDEIWWTVNNVAWAWAMWVWDNMEY